MADRNRKLKEASKHADKFQGDLDTMALWLEFNEEKLALAAVPGLQKDVVAKQLKDAQVSASFRETQNDCILWCVTLTFSVENYW